MKAVVEFTGSIEVEADDEADIAKTAEELLNDIESALTTWRTIYEAMGWAIHLNGRVSHEDGRLWMELPEPT